MPKWINQETGEIVDYNPPVEMGYCGVSPITANDVARLDEIAKKEAQKEAQNFSESNLKNIFSSFPGKTLKLKVKEGETLERSVLAAYRYVSNPRQEFNRIEFKYGDCYVVVARLKEEKR